jgi:hypothetical protein
VPALTKNKKNCLVKVIGYDNKGKKVGSDKSDSPFTIEVVKLTSPNGDGEPLVSDTLVDITWKANQTKSDVTKVVLSYTTNGGTTWKPIETLSGDTYPPDPYSRPWTVPEVGASPKNKCKVKVVLKDASGKVVGSDTSEAFFTINPAPSP